MFKPWHVATSSFHLANNLNKCRCQHEPGFKHDHAKGKETPKTAFYPETMSRYISECLYPSNTFAMPVIVKADGCGHHAHTHCHVGQSKVQKGDSQDHHSHMPNLPDLESVYAGVHLLLDRRDWHNHPGYQEAIDKEVNGILENGTWDYTEVIPRSELIKRKEPMHVGRLMTILSVKHWETPSLRRLKARVVFRGDDIRDQENNLAVLQEAKVNPSGLAGINANLAYGCLKGHKTTQSDVVRAYTQSDLNTAVPTWVELPVELTPVQYRGISRPCVRLRKSLYGHPEAGFHWDQRFKQIMQSLGAVHLADTFQSSYYLKQFRLLLTLYVDDMIVSGPESEHKKLWDLIGKEIEIEPPTPVDRVLGRNHHVSRNSSGTSMEFGMTEFVQSACASYEELSGCVLKPATTPYVPEGSLVDSDFEVRGEMASDASKVLMKILWAARLARPDIQRAITELTRRIVVWSRADDRRLHRLMCYLHGTPHFVLKGFINDDPSVLKLSLFTDADHASSLTDAKSTSGMFLVLEGPNSLWPLCWSSKKQTATARSTCEAEMLSLDSGVFGEAIPMQDLWETVLDRPVVLTCFQDNSSVIQIIKAGYSPKLRHMKKVHKLNLSALYEIFECPDVLINYIKTSMQRADPFTKSLAPNQWDAALGLMSIFPRSILKT